MDGRFSQIIVCEGFGEAVLAVAEFHGGMKLVLTFFPEWIVIAFSFERKAEIPKIRGICTSRKSKEAFGT